LERYSEREWSRGFIEVVVMILVRVELLEG
jgi:hypothetical protein